MKKGYTITKEQNFIRKLLQPLTNTKYDKQKLKDDAAVIKINSQNTIVISTDTIIQGVHFPKNETPQNIATKAIRTAISDLFAKGVKPNIWTLNIAGKKHIFQSDFIKKFITQLQKEQKKWKCNLIGGDTVIANIPLTITITVIGYAQKNKVIRRNGAKPNHKIYVTGTIGDANLGLQIAQKKQNNKNKIIEKLQSKDQKFLLKQYQIPQIHAEISDIIKNYASAAMDISDGLVGDLELLCQASNVSAIVNTTQIPLSNAARQYLKMNPEKNAFINLITGGDDYQVLCTVPEENCSNVEKKAREHAIRITQIGVVTNEKKSPIFKDENGKTINIKNKSWSHLK